MLLLQMGSEIYSRAGYCLVDRPGAVIKSRIVAHCRRLGSRIKVDITTFSAMHK